ncbi:murein hydrolase activator EnvC family protein [Nonlabens sp.]|uniref:murein hydrolase activator EnvC family protein n=1 Tax=Nonlabens sp. TaxID=1888209 RepID=UPI003F694FD1
MVRKGLLFGLMFMCFAFAKAQSQKAQLEAKKAKIQAEINQYTRLLSGVKKESKTMVLRVETIDKKIASTQELINITNKQANLITRSIKRNTDENAKLKKEIKAQKDEYARMIVKAYKSKNEQSRLMFLLSSEDFLQAYKRVQYLKSYADYRKTQADEITAKSKRLEEINNELELEKMQKQEVLKVNKQQRIALQEDKQEQENLLAVVKQDEKKYAQEIRDASKERARIDRQIKKLIEADIAASNKGKTGAVKGKFFLSPEAKVLANNFKSNKGKLPYPVDKFIISRTYGDQPHPVLGGIRISSNGLRFQAPANSVAKAIFTGKVVRVQKAANGILSVYVRHGNYTSIYDHLKSVSVQKGDQVSTRDVIGTVFTDNSGVTELRFVLMEDSHTVDPSRWLLRF